MVDISDKKVTRRVARASCLVVVPATATPTPSPASSDVLVARLAGIQAAKRTAELIPLCHPLSLASVQLDVTEHPRGLLVTSEVVTDGRTGVEMEALTACSFAALTLLNALVASHPGTGFEDLTLLRKSGGQSGDWGCDVTEGSSMTPAPRGA